MTLSISDSIKRVLGKRLKRLAMALMAYSNHSHPRSKRLQLRTRQWLAWQPGVTLSCNTSLAQRKPLSQLAALSWQCGAA